MSRAAVVDPVVDVLGEIGVEAGADAGEGGGDGILVEDLAFLGGGVDEGDVVGEGAGDLGVVERGEGGVGGEEGTSGRWKGAATRAVTKSAQASPVAGAWARAAVMV